jgi:EAL domain-containing protein (putative c-di-GMP-specific phosphodiesterase class I)
MYAAKSSGKNRVRYYRARMNEHTRARTALDAALAQALERGEFELHYQPVWRASRRRISSCEALLRWRRPGHGLLLPGEFLGTAEEVGLAGRLTQLVIGDACAMAGRIRAAGFDVPLSINLSCRQLVEGDVAARIGAALAAERLEASSLQVEIREAALAAEDPRVHRVLAALAAMGVAIVVDDFGSGVSSLRALGRLRPGAIKIDGALARELPDGQDAAALVSAVVALARTLRVQVVAEGVETEVQARRLRALGCDDLQGYYYGHALPADEWLGYLRWACSAVVGSDGPRSGRTRRRRAETGAGQDVAAFPTGTGLPGIPGAPRLTRTGHVVLGRFRT